MADYNICQINSADLTYPIILMLKCWPYVLGQILCSGPMAICRGLISFLIVKQEGKKAPSD